MAIVGKDIGKAKEILDNSDLVAIPTETVYGLAGNALDSKAVARIFEVKERPYFDPLIVHFAGISKIKKYVKRFPALAEDLAKKFWPGPLTMILEKKEAIPDLVTSGLNTVAVRVPNHPLTQKLLKSLDFPLAAPSANPFGYISPTEAFHVQAQLGEKIDYVLDGGACQVGIESTIVGFDEEKLLVYRLGGVTMEELRHFTDNIEMIEPSGHKYVAPGMLGSHYSPTTPIVLGDIPRLFEEYQGKNIGVLSFEKRYFHDLAHQFILSESGDLPEAAANLFSALRKLDALKLDLIMAEKVPDHGLGRAINDRLKRAAAKTINV